MSVLLLVLVSCPLMLPQAYLILRNIRSWSAPLHKWLHVSVVTVKTLRKAADRTQAAQIAERRATFGVYCCRSKL